MKKWLKFLLIFLIILAISVIVLAFIGSKGGKLSPNIFHLNKGTKKTPLNEVVVDNVRFKLVSLKNLGSVLQGKDAPYLKRISNLQAEGKFLEITLSAENLGTTSQPYWFVSYLVDGEGKQLRTGWKAESWIPQNDECYGRLDPGKAPKICKKIFDVPLDAAGLKLKVEVGLKYNGLLNLGI